MAKIELKKYFFVIGGQNQRKKSDIIVGPNEVPKSHHPHFAACWRYSRSQLALFSIKFIANFTSLSTRLHPQGEVAPQEPIGTKLIRGADSFRSDVFFKVRGGCLSECDHCDVTNQLLNISHPPRTILLYSIIESFCLITGGWICDRPDG